MPELAERLGLDLSDTLTSDLELSSNLLKRSRAAVLKTEAELDYLLLPGGEGMKNVAKLLAKE